MKLLCAVLCISVLFQNCVAPPVTANKKEDSKDNEVDGAEHKGADWDVGLEYNRYLQEVVQALESDPQFRDKLEKAEVADIRTGKIASELEFVNHNVRSKLDELKRTELERLRHLAYKQAELQRQQQQHHEQESEGNDPGHVDHENPHTFEVEDLKKLIVKTTKDLEEADRKRREEFKEYEMQKEFEKQQQLNLLDEQHKKEMEQKIKEQEEKHRQHPNVRLNHPGSKHQLEEVWEEQDHMNPDDFNPKTFFYLHDLDGNGYWDADEVKALFQKELDKMYDPNAPEDDMRERREEMERMREHVFNETDVNRDRLISYQEFLDQTKKQEFEQDQGWESLDKDKVYTHDEYEQFEKRRQAEIQQMVQQGLLPPAPDLHLPYGMQVPPEYLQQQHQQNLQYQQQHHQIPPHAQPQYHPQGGAPMHPNQVPQYHGGAPPQGYHPPPAYQHQQGYQPPAPQAFHAQQHPNAQGHPNNIPQGHPNQQVHPNDIPLQGHPNMPPQHHQQQGHPNIPPQQGHPNMPPPQHQQQGIPQQGHPNMPPQQGHPNIPPPQQQHPNIPPQNHPNIPPQNHPNSQGHPNIPPVQGQPVNPPQAASQEHQKVPVHHNSEEPAQPVHHNSEQKHDSKEPPSHN